MDAYSAYRISVTGWTGINWALAEVEMREAFSGPNVIGGGSASANIGEGGSGDGSEAVDGSPNTSVVIRMNIGQGWWQYNFPSPVKIREYALLTQSPGNYPTELKLFGWDGAKWVELNHRTGLAFTAGVVQTFSLFELAGTAKFSDGAVAAGGFINRTDTGEKISDILPDIDGNFSVLTQDAGPFDVLIFRSGYRPLVWDNQPASEA